MTGLVGALVEAWDELRIHKLRVLLALIGVACAVTAITGVTAAVSMLKQAFQEQTDRGVGRPVTLMVNVSPAGPEAVANPDIDTVFAQVLERYSIEYASRQEWTQVQARFPDGTRALQMQAVDQDYSVINRTVPTQGRWFADADVQAFSPTLVVNEAFLTSLGLADLSTHPTILLGGEAPVRATVVGVLKNDWPEAEPTAFILYDQLHRWIGTDGNAGPPGQVASSRSVDMMQSFPAMQVWVPTGAASELSDAIQHDVAASVPGWQVDVFPNGDGGDPIGRATKWVGIGIGALALLLGGLGLVNIALVTVKYRIREIGIRRSFGATSGRVFFGVMLESVVATVVAGLVGVVVAVAIIKNIPIERVFGSQIDDMPPFPVSAALVGMACATAVGALAGIIPATVAVRVKVIDAIRY
ncbi:ABC transporter permease [Cellulomonas sp. URHB0016]